jgi:hypothetical protein
MTTENVAHAKLMNAVGAMRPLLKAASDAVHEPGPPPEDERIFNRVVELGWLTEFASDLCTPNLRILSALAMELSRIEEEHDDVEQKELHS